MGWISVFPWFIYISHRCTSECLSVHLTFIILGEFHRWQILKYFLIFFQETGFDISCILSPNVKLFSGRKKWINMLSTEIAQRVLTINFQQMTFWKFFFSENWIWHFMHMVSNRDSLHEMSNSVGWKTKKSIKYIVCWNCPDSGKGEELQNYFCTEKLST